MLAGIVAICAVCGLILRYGIQEGSLRRALALVWRLGGRRWGRRTEQRRVVYADYAGCPPASPRLLRACLKDLEVRMTRDGVVRNPHSERRGSVAGCSESVQGQPSGTASLDDLRERTLRYCGASREEYVCVITSGATAGCRLVGEAYFGGHRGRQQGGQDGATGPSRRGVDRDDDEFAFLVDNHTSVVGIQGIADVQARSVEVADLFRGEHASGRRGRKLFAFPGESNFSGARYSLEAVDHWQARGYRVLLDAAKSCASRPPDLGRYKPDFVVLSYYKLFGYPSGLGALLMRHDAAKELEAQAYGYYGGGTVAYVVPERGRHFRRKRLPYGFEHGTPSYLGVPQALVGFSWLEREFGHGESIDVRAVRVATDLARRLLQLVHGNGRPVCAVYGSWSDVLRNGRWEEKVRTYQGPVVAFNVMDHNGRVVGCRDVERAAEMRGIVLRSGSLCNSGGLRMALGLSVDEIVEVWRQVVVMADGEEVDPSPSCDDGIVLPDGTPTGVLRASFGYASTMEDAGYIADFVSETFQVDTNQSDGLDRPSQTHGDNPVLEIARIYIYPIKSCQPQRVTSWEVDGTRSLVYDRRWKLVDEAGNALTVKQYPMLSRIAPKIDLERQVLRIEVTDRNRPSGDLAFVEVPLDGSHEEAIPASTWLSGKLGGTCRLVRSTNTRNYSNRSHTLVMHAATIELIRTASGSQATFDEFALRMRPNVIIRDVQTSETSLEQHVLAEDAWSELSCVSDAAVHATVVRPCTRCDRVCIDPKTGLLDQHDSGAVLNAIVTAKRGTASSFLTLGVLVDFSSPYGDACLLSDRLKFRLKLH